MNEAVNPDRSTNSQSDDTSLSDHGSNPDMVEIPADKRQAKQILRRSRRSIFGAFLERARKESGKTTAIIDGDGRKLTYQDITRAAFGLGGPIAKKTQSGEHVGILLPTGAGVLISVLPCTRAGASPLC